MRRPIARKLALRLFAAFTAAFALLLAGTYYSFRREAILKGVQYLKLLVGVYSDIIMHEAHTENVPADLSFYRRFNYFGEYLCSWYRVDYIYAYVPDLENGTITYISVSRNRNKFGDLSRDHMGGVTEKHTLTPEELKVWNGEIAFGTSGNVRFEEATDVIMLLKDDFGNKVMVGAATHTNDLQEEVKNGFVVIALFIIFIAAVLSGLLYVLMRRMVSEPASRISEQMSEYISEGKKSAIKLESDGDDEFAMIADAFNKMTEDIDKYIIDIARLGRDKERQQAEVDIATDIQKGFLPSGYASLANCIVKAVMKPARHIGGDLYYYIELDAARTMAVVADVSGKGISSAMFMVMTLTLIRQFARMGYSPSEILRNVNDHLSEKNPKMMFVTAFVGIYDSSVATFTYANAGHNPPYLIHGRPVMLDGTQGTPLGIFQDEEYSERTVRMEEGDSVFLYTDGISEAVNASGEFYGTSRLEKTLEDTAVTAGRGYVNAVDASVRAFTDGTEQNDDITMLVLRARENTVLELDYDIKEFGAIREILFASGLPENLLMELCIAAEECFVNICSYAFEGPVPEGEKILFSFEYADKVEMRFTDGGRPFDPRHDLPDAEEYDIDNSVGGLGRLIAFSIADSVDYERLDGKNILTITKSVN
ncbi:MAG: SpoIIE family protein phosphatase [Bacteroidales bacterium]|nr:SpoIIE family protein phosphatase [Bacteroidales bacterium]